MPISGSGAPQLGQAMLFSGSPARPTGRRHHPPTRLPPPRPARSAAMLGRHVRAALRAGAVTRAGEQHPQVGVDLGGGADRRARRAVTVALVHADGGREPDDGIHRRAALVGHHAQRFHILALAFLVQRIEGHRRFARPRQAGEDHELILGDREGDVFEVVEPRAADGNFRHEQFISVEPTRRRYCYHYVNIELSISSTEQILCQRLQDFSAPDQPHHPAIAVHHGQPFDLVL